ncbi:MAG: hypothetical protein PHR79_08485 [Bacteroidales bacterium]|nr:hypothetical protein [Bacteroidales bacterium]
MEIKELYKRSNIVENKKLFSAFGLPLGVAFGACIENMGMHAIGIPLGMLIAMTIGSYMNKKAF